MAEIKSSKDKEPVQITFGDFIEPSDGSPDRFIIIHIKDGNTCEVALITTIQEQEALMPQGGVSRNFIGKIQPELRWGIDRIKKACAVFNGDNRSDTTIDIYSKSKSRILK